MGKSAVYIVLLAAIGAGGMFFFSSGIPGMQDIQATRDLPEHAYPGDTVTVALTFKLPERQAVTVEEQITTDSTSWTETVSVSNIKEGRVIYETQIPKTANGTVQFAGTVRGYGEAVGGDTSITVVTDDDTGHTPPAPADLLPETVNGFDRTDLMQDGAPSSASMVATATATYTRNGSDHTVTVDQFTTVDGSYTALMDTVDDRDKQRTTVNTENAYRTGDHRVMWDQNEFLYTVSGPAPKELADKLHEVHLDVY